MSVEEQRIREQARRHGQEHVFRFWDELDENQRRSLLHDLEQVDFELMDRLIRDWVKNDPPPESFSQIEPVPVIPPVEPDRADAREAFAAGEAALREGRVGIFLVAGGQGTRLGFDGPKGAYPIGPVSKKSLFEFHAEKIRYFQRRYDCVLPWYIMVSEANGPATQQFFSDHDHFGLDPKDIYFITQRMVPCVDEQGKFMLEQPGGLAMNPNGHGGCIPALVESGVIADTRDRGIDILSYFQVDNWAVQLVDPYYIGYHALSEAEMSSKNHRKHDAREAVGVHCLCDGEYRVVEYSELDIYPQLLELKDGQPVHYAGNPAIHLLSPAFVQRVYDHFDQFPWHRAHKKVAYIDGAGNTVTPAEPNAYKFETFVFDALRFVQHAPVALELDPPGEYTPIKSFSGANSVEAAWQRTANYWGRCLEQLGCDIPRDADGNVAIRIEVSPEFAPTCRELLRQAPQLNVDASRDFGIDPQGRVFYGEDS